MMTENSNDLLTTFKLLDENDAEFIEHARIPSYIYVGKFTKKEHPEIFNFLQLKKDKDCKILVYHTENFYMIDDDEVDKIIITEITSEKNRLNELEDKKAKSLNEQSKLTMAEAEILKTINELDDFNNSFDDLSHEQKQIRLKDLLESITYVNDSFNIKKTI